MLEVRMRRTLVLLGLAVATSSPALAQSNQGAFALDAMFAPTTGLGFAYYVTDGLSLRPWLGLGYSDLNGFFANVGAELRYEFLADGTVSPYLSASAQYSHNGSIPVAPGPTGTGNANYQQLAIQSDSGQFGAGGGVRVSVSRSLALFGEGRVLYTTYPMGSYGTGWSTVQLGDQSRFEAVIGLTYLFH
jgi:hypothetical protein